jgi:hypothetical protein
LRLFIANPADYPNSYTYSYVFVVNPSLNSHHDGESGMGRGFGRGFRGRGGIRPGMGRAEFGPPDMAMAAPWMGEYTTLYNNYGETRNLIGQQPCRIRQSCIILQIYSHCKVSLYDTLRL